MAGARALDVILTARGLDGDRTMAMSVARAERADVAGCAGGAGHPGRGVARCPGRAVVAGRGERAAIAVLLGAVFALRAVYAFRFRVDTDEPQHLHVAWAWAHGLVQYRDVFDNHMPLFHLLTAPLVAALGERPDIVPLMRLAMLPLYALTLWATYRLGRPLVGARAALWAAVLVAWMPPFFRCSLEFRADDLWAPVWLLALAIAVAGELSAARALAAGLIVGVAIGVSMKTSLLLATLAVGTVVAVALRPDGSVAASLARLARCALAFAAGAALVPAMIAVAFAAAGAWDAFLYGTIRHNVVPSIGEWGRQSWMRTLLFPAIIALGTVAAALVSRWTTDAALARRRSALVVAAAGYLGGLAGVWPLITREDYLPFYPLLAVGVAPLALALPLARRRALPWPPLALVAIEIATLIGGVPPWVDDARPQIGFVADVLRLTRPGDAVFDFKGETIFRPRAFYWGLESITKFRIEAGLIPDSIPESLVATATHVAVLDSAQLPPRGRRFLADHYVSVGGLRVAGERLRCAAGEVMPFETVIPGVYRLVEERAPSGTVAAPSVGATGDPAASAGADAAGVATASEVGVAAASEVDGAPLGAGRFLAPGPHRLVARRCRGPLVLIWAPAIERGFLPVAAAPEVASRAP